jgi:hypothetical protein
VKNNSAGKLRLKKNQGWKRHEILSAHNFGWVDVVRGVRRAGASAGRLAN